MRHKTAQLVLSAPASTDSGNLVIFAGKTLGRHQRLMGEDAASKRGPVKALARTLGAALVGQHQGLGPLRRRGL